MTSMSQSSEARGPARTLRIVTFSDLEAWLEDNHWLEEATLETVDPLPSRERCTSVSLDLAMQIAGGYDAGELRVVGYYRIRCREIVECSVPDIGVHRGSIIDGIQTIDSPHGAFALAIAEPISIRIVCREVIIEQEEIEDVVPEWFSPSDFHARVRDARLPSPRDWIAWFRSQGADVCWRYLHGEEKDATQVPIDYIGWFLQYRSLISRSPGGLFIRDCRETRDGFNLSVEVTDAAAHPLLVAAGRYLLLNPSLSVRSGNVTLDRDRWREHLDAIDPV
jgi:hypothetical protein